MECRETGGSKVLLFVGLLLVASCHCERLTKLKALDTPRGNSTFSHGQVKGGEVSHGRLLIGPNSLQGAKLKGNKTTENLQDYQADMGWVKLKQHKGGDDDDEFSKLKQDEAAVERLLKMEPKVECTGDSMKLKVEDAASTPGSLLFVDRGKELSPLPLSKLPSSCGYTIRSMRRDLVLVAPYDGCFVTLQEDNYVLPLRWSGLPVKMSCPLMRQASSNPPMVTCHPEGMVVKTDWTMPVAKIKVNLTGNWEPLMKASPRCGFSVVVHPEGVVISVSYASCLEIKDGMYTLELAGDGEVKISCPSMSPAQAKPTKGQAKAPKEQTETPGKGVYPANPAPTSAREPPSKIPAQSAVHQVPGFPENPKLPNKKPMPNPFNHQSESPQGQVPQQFNPYFYYQPKPDNQSPPAEKPTAAPQPESPQGQVPQQFNPYFYYHPKPDNQSPPAEKPTAAPQPESPQGQVPQQFNPYFYYHPKPDNQSPPAEKPTAAPQPESPQGQVPQQFNPYFYYYSKPDGGPRAEKPPAAAAPPATEKPTAVPQPSEPVGPQGQVPQQFNPYFYYHPKPDNQSPPAEKPTAAPQPESPQGQVPQQFNPYFYYHPKPDNQSPPAEKPTVAPQPESPQGQVPQQFNPYFYYYSKPDGGPPAEKPPAAPAPSATEKPTAVPQPSEPVGPQGQVPQQFNPYFYYHPKPDNQSPPAEKPTAAPQPESPQGQVPQQFNPYFYYHPKPDNQSPPAEKPTAAPQPESPQGQVPQQFNPYFYYHPKPDNQSLPAEKPTAAPQPESPQGQVPQQFNPYFYYYSKPDGGPPAEKPPAAPQPESPQGQVPQQFNPYFYYHPKPDNQSPPAEKPTAAPQPESPQGQVPQQFSPYFYYYPTPEDEGLPAEKPTSFPMPPATSAPQPEAPQGQVPQQFNPYFYYYSKPGEGPSAEKPPAAPAPSGTEKPTAVPQPSEPVAPQGQVPQQFNPYVYHYPTPEDEGLPAEKPTSFPMPPATEKPTSVPQPEAPQGQVPQQFNPYYFYYPKPDDGLSTEKPTAVPIPPAIETPKGQMHKPSYPQPFKIPDAGTNDANPSDTPVSSQQPPIVNPSEGWVPYPFNPYYFPQQLKPVTLPPATSMQQPPKTTTLASSQAPQSGSSYVPPMYCSQYCSPGHTNCCPQIAFHQHLHHIVPAGTGSEKLPSIYPGLPFLPSAYSGFDNGFAPNAPLKPTEAATTFTSAPISTQSPPSGNDKQPYNQPPGGNPAVLPGNDPSKPTNPQQIYPYFVPNSGYPYQLYQPQNELQNSPQRKSPAHHTVPSNPQAPGYEPVNQMLSNIQPPTQQNNQPSAGDMNQPSSPNFWPLVSQRLRQHVAKRQSRPEGLNNSTQPQSLLSASKKPTRYEQNANPYSEPKRYVLLQHGPPGREPNNFNKPPLPNFLAQNLARYQSSKPQHSQTLMPPQEKPQHPKWQGKVMSNPVPGNVNHMPGIIEKSERPPLLYSASDAPHLVPLPPHP